MSKETEKLWDEVALIISDENFMEWGNRVKVLNERFTITRKVANNLQPILDKINKGMLDHQLKHGFHSYFDFLQEDLEELVTRLKADKQ